MIQHVSRVVPHEALEPCVEFYRLLGFAEVPAPSGIGPRARWLEPAVGIASGTVTQLHLLPGDEARAEQGHLAIVVADYAGVITELEAHGHAAEPRDPHWGAQRAYVHDPAGHLVELMEREPR